MVNSRKKGDNFERMVKKYLLDFGFLCYRNSASAFPDLIAIDKKGVYFIECKMNKYISKDERLKFESLKGFGECFICFNEKGKIRFCDIDYKPKSLNI
jgi:Holliday junction resolvase